MSEIPVTKPDELELSKMINKRIDQGSEIVRRFASISSSAPTPGSDLAGDDRATSWMHSSHVIIAALAMATDNMRACGEMLRPSGNLRVPLYAHYPVIRSVLESSALAKWLLYPDNAKDRIERSLRVRMSDAKEDFALRKEEQALLAALDDSPDAEAIAAEEQRARARHARDVSKIRDIAAAHEIPWASIKDGLPPWVHLIRAVCALDAAGSVRVPGNYAAAVWKVMSGLSHPSLSRAANHSDVTRLPQPAENGTFYAQLTPSFRLTLDAMTLAWNTANEAVQLLEQRQLTPRVR